MSNEPPVYLLAHLDVSAKVRVIHPKQGTRLLTPLDIGAGLYPDETIHTSKPLSLVETSSASPFPLEPTGQSPFSVRRPPVASESAQRIRALLQPGGPTRSVRLPNLLTPYNEDTIAPNEFQLEWLPAFGKGAGTLEIVQPTGAKRRWEVKNLQEKKPNSAALAEMCGYLSKLVQKEKERKVQIRVFRAFQPHPVLQADIYLRTPEERQQLDNYLAVWNKGTLTPFPIVRQIGRASVFYKYNAVERAILELDPKRALKAPRPAASIPLLTMAIELYKSTQQKERAGQVKTELLKLQKRKGR